MRLLRHPVAALVLFAVLIGLCIIVYQGIEDNYSVTKGDIQTIENRTTGNVMDQLQNMTLVSGVASIQKGIEKLKPPTGSPGGGDVLGGLASVGIGAVKSIIGVVTTPFEIVRIITLFYTDLPVGILITLVMIVAVYAGFILLSIYVGREV